MDTYDFKLQCSGVWQSYLGLSFSGEKAKASKECPAGTMAYGWRSFPPQGLGEASPYSASGTYALAKTDPRMAAQTQFESAN